MHQVFANSIPSRSACNRLTKDSCIFDFTRPWRAQLKGVLSAKRITSKNDLTRGGSRQQTFGQRRLNAANEHEIRGDKGKTRVFNDARHAHHAQTRAGGYGFQFQQVKRPVNHLYLMVSGQPVWHRRVISRASHSRDSAPRHPRQPRVSTFAQSASNSVRARATRYAPPTSCTVITGDKTTRPSP